MKHKIIKNFFESENVINALIIFFLKFISLCVPHPPVFLVIFGWHMMADSEGRGSDLHQA